MEITWSGHSCFTVRGKETTLVFDPCPPDFGCASRWGSPQAVLVSHNHPGHSYTSELKGAAHIFSGPGEYEVGGAFISGLGTFHDGERGADRGKNTVYVVEMEGLTLCHLGDLGHALTGQLARELGKVDILFVPVGDVTTLSVAEARALARTLQPRYVLPMHYQTEKARHDLEPIETFLQAMATPQAETRPRLQVSSTTLPLTAQVVVLSCDGRIG